MAGATLLLVEDDPSHRELYGTVLERAGYDVMRASNADEALRALETRVPDLILTDVVMPTMSGMSLLRELMNLHPGVGVILQTSQPQIADAVEAIKIGALDYLDKSSLIPPTRLAERVAAALQKRQRKSAGHAAGFHGMVGNDPKMRSACLLIQQVADSIANVLVYGETGSGKELAARAIHAESKRADGPFITLDCSTLAPELAESELFGHEKGAFSGAVSQHRGRFERAHRGTLLLDEVGNLTVAMQAKLLRVIQTRTFERVGGEKSIAADVRIVAASNRSLEEMINEGGFRRDLYHRLNVVQIRLPSLRERLQDVPELVNHFLARYATQAERQPPQWTPAAMAKLQEHDWPGNIRELENFVYRVVLLCQKPVIDTEDVNAFLAAQELAPAASAPATPQSAAGASPMGAPSGGPAPAPAPAPLDLSSQVEAQEKDILTKALARNRYNLSRTAKELKISRTTLYSKLSKYGIPVP
ncbi:MAG: sigma-54-dependent Fis family transcriptional regulator [Verrucomicrobia bacterium]|nr:sigma-54-dependent Fis family transcriptional regulator [Verrucomicrobiota bacterium]